VDTDTKGIVIVGKMIHIKAKGESVKTIKEKRPEIGRIMQEIEVDGKKRIALFDTESTMSLITESALPECAGCLHINPVKTRIVGVNYTLEKRCLINSKIEGLDFVFSPFVINKPVMVDKQKVDIIIGAATMRTWDIKLDPKKKKLDLTGLKKREFISFYR